MDVPWPLAWRQPGRTETETAHHQMNSADGLLGPEREPLKIGHLPFPSSSKLLSNTLLPIQTPYTPLLSFPQLPSVNCSHHSTHR